MNSHPRHSCYFLSNTERLECYVRMGVNSSYIGKDHGISKSWRGADVPFYFNPQTETELLGKKTTPRGQKRYIKDFLYFLHVVGAREKLPVQFGDGELKSTVLSGMAFKKARRINGKGILLKLKIDRHWDFSENFDIVNWAEKDSSFIWRGEPTGLAKGPSNNGNANIRFCLVEKYTGRFNVGFSSKGGQGDDTCLPYIAGSVSRSEQLKYKFIISLEGNDVATNLKWILASNSVPVMIKPRYESWLLESKLVPWVHYIPLSDSLDNLPELHEWCLSNDSKCKDIANNGKAYMRMFFDNRNEDQMYRDIYNEFNALNSVFKLQG